MQPSEPHPDTPVFLTPLGAETLKVERLVQAIEKVAAVCLPSEMAPGPWGEVIGILIRTLREVGETRAADKLEAMARNELAGVGPGANS